MRLLCATDLSSRSDRAVRRAAALARASAAEFILLSVVDDDQPERLVASERREVAALLAEQTATMPEMQGLAVRVLVESGDAFDAIIRVAREQAVDVIVMGEHRKRLLADMFVGTTVERVIRRGHWPVLMVNRPATRQYRHVLAAIDMSESSAHALRAFLHLGIAAGAAVTMFHAYQALGRTSLLLAGMTDRATEEHAAAAASQARHEVSAFVQSLTPDTGSLPFGIALEEGPPVEALRRAVDRLEPDLVVMGTGGHGAASRLVLGSFAEEAMRALECDVLAVPPVAVVPTRDR